MWVGRFPPTPTARQRPRWALLEQRQADVICDGRRRSLGPPRPHLSRRLRLVHWGQLLQADQMWFGRFPSPPTARQRPRWAPHGQRQADVSCYGQRRRMGPMRPHLSRRLRPAHWGRLLQECYKTGWKRRQSRSRRRMTRQMWTAVRPSAGLSSGAGTRRRRRGCRLPSAARRRSSSR